MSQSQVVAAVADAASGAMHFTTFVAHKNLEEDAYPHHIIAS